MIEGIYRLLLSDFVNPVNIGNPDEISIREFAEEIISLTKSKLKIIYKPLPKDDPSRRRPDISLANQLFNWNPKVSRKEGLKMTYDYFKSLPIETLSSKEHNNFNDYIKK
jgi:dTDP-glucose 4,6-dehydratase